MRAVVHDIVGRIKWVPNAIVGNSGNHKRPQVVSFDLIRQMQFPIGVLYLTVSEITVAEMHNSTFSMPHWSSSVEFWITEYYDQGRRQVKTPTYPVVCRFPLFVALCDHIHQSYRRTDGRTDVMHRRDRHILHVALKTFKCQLPKLLRPMSTALLVTNFRNFNPDRNATLPGTCCSRNRRGVFSRPR